MLYAWGTGLSQGLLEGIMLTASEDSRGASYSYENWHLGMGSRPFETFNRQTDLEYNMP